MECPFETNIEARKPDVERQIVNTNNGGLAEEMVQNRAFPIIKDEKVYRPVTSSSILAIQQNIPSPHENDSNSISFNKGLQTGRKDNIPILLQRHSKCPYLGRNVIDHPSNGIENSTNSCENGKTSGITNLASNKSNGVSSRNISDSKNGVREFMTTPLQNTANAISHNAQNAISEIHSSNNDLMQKRSFKCNSSSSISGTASGNTNDSSSPSVCKMNSNVAQPVSSNKTLISQNIDCPFSTQSSSSFHVSKNVVSLTL